MNILSALHQGATIITPNNRLSNQLLQDYYHEFNPSKNSISKPHCLPYQAFLRQLFIQIQHQHPAIEHPLLLSKLQQRHLWRQVLEKQSDYPCNAGLLDEIQDAWTRCQYWQIPLGHPAFLVTPQTRQFQQWQQAFQAELTQHAVITEEQLVNYLLEYAPFVQLNIFWVCFDAYTPQQQALKQALIDCEQYEYDLPAHSASIYQYAAQDRQDEYEQLITWIQTRLKAGDKRIGVVIPDLQNQENELQRFLQQQLPEDQFNISLGKSLNDFPIVTHALHWLSLEKTTLTHHQAQLLLHSPYLIGSKQEFLARADILQNNAVMKESVLFFDAFIQAIQTRAPQLSQKLLQLNPYPSEASPREWVKHFKQRLTLLGFPGEYSLNSTSYQCFQRFITLFDELMQYAIISPLLTQKQAFNALQELVQHTVFQTKKPITPIVILGLLEASGCTFDSIWMSGLTDQCLPQKTNLSAFIPIELQRNLKMPHACAIRELQLAQQLIARMQHASQFSVFSYPRFIGDTPHLPSPLLTDLVHLNRVELPPTLALSSSLIPYSETYCLPLQTTENATGGTALLANQAKCPFRAFAAHRLHAESSLVISEGPDASERGQMIHKIMELFWRELQSQEKFLAYSNSQLAPFIDKIISTTLNPITSMRAISFSPIAQEVERQRLTRLVYAAIEWERQRIPFNVEAIEQSFSISLAGIDFRVRVDRLDRILTEDGKEQKMVIDYKTTIPANKPWYEEHPEAPQLLLYALLDTQIHTLLFIQLKAGRVSFSSFSEQNLKKGESWQNYQQQWHQQLTNLAQEFKNGECHPKPNRASTCMQCDFQNLCRIEL